MPLSSEQILQLLKDDTPPRDRGPVVVPVQNGPLRFVDDKLRCACRGCSSPTYIKVNGIPRCMIHALRELNDIIVQGGGYGEYATVIDSSHRAEPIIGEL